MLPGPDEILACPSCGKPLSRPTLVSGNTFGAVLWSDGKREAPMLPESPVLATCTHCRQVFWTEDAKSLGQLRNGYFDHGEPEEATPEAWRSAPELTEAEAPEMLALFERTTDLVRMRFLAIRAWHLLNDPARKTGSLEAKAVPLFRENLERLLGLLDEAQPNDRIMKAEALRELGRHPEALALLAEKVPVNLKRAAGRIQELAAEGKTEVVRLNLD